MLARALTASLTGCSRLEPSCHYVQRESSACEGRVSLMVQLARVQLGKNHQSLFFSVSLSDQYETLQGALIC
jgi:hypothetical protein